MPSNSLQRWNSQRSKALDEIKDAHARIGGSARGRRYATQQLNYAYATLLSSQFQGFCRDLHSESVDQFIAALPGSLQPFVRAEFIWNRNLDRGNPHPGAIGSDFGRLGVHFWPKVDGLDGRNPRRRELLQELVDWRNAIAHQDFASVAPGGSHVLHLSMVRAWRRAVGALAECFDTAMYNYLSVLIGIPPW